MTRVGIEKLQEWGYSNPEAFSQNRKIRRILDSVWTTKTEANSRCSHLSHIGKKNVKFLETQHDGKKIYLVFIFKVRGLPPMRVVGRERNFPLGLFGAKDFRIKKADPQLAEFGEKKQKATRKK